MALLTPARRRGVEWLDEDRDPALQRRSHRDIALANRLFGGIHAVQAELAPWLRAAGASATLLDVGTGTGDIPDRLRRFAASHDVTLEVLDRKSTRLNSSHSQISYAVSCSKKKRSPAAPARSAPRNSITRRPRRARRRRQRALPAGTRRLTTHAPLVGVRRPSGG